MSSTSHIYKGYWVNYSQGRIGGATITLSQSSGGLLSNFLSIYITFAGAMLWLILRFIIHQIQTKKTGEISNGLKRQRQIILRNSGHSTAVLAFLTLPLRSKASPGRYLQCLPYAIIALFCLVGFGIAGIFSSTISKAAGKSALLVGNSCGMLKPNDSLLLAKYLADTYETANYARQCYGDNPGSPCGLFVRPSLPFTINPNASCPFESDFCNGTALQMDTGRLDSHFDFGINARPEERIQFRRVTTCAPLNVLKIPIRRVNLTDTGPTMFINAGRAPEWERFAAIAPNATFQYLENTNSVNVGLQLSAQLHMQFDSSYGDPAAAVTTSKLNDNQWNPIAPLNRSDGEVTLMMLASNSFKYTAPVDDPFFSAHGFSNATEGSPVWYGDYFVTFLGCLDQYQICNSTAHGNDGCTPLTSADMLIGHVIKDPYFVDLNLGKLTTYLRFALSAGTRERTMYASVNNRGANALNVLEHSFDKVSPPLPKTQWQREVTIWFKTALAKEQFWAIEWATGPRNLQSLLNGEVANFTTFPPDSDEGLKQCRQQMVNDLGAHQNFSVLGLVLAFVLGGVIILLGASVDVVFGWLVDRGWLGLGGFKYKKEQWDSDELLRLYETSHDEGSALFKRQDGVVSEADRKLGVSVAESEDLGRVRV